MNPPRIETLPMDTGGVRVHVITGQGMRVDLGATGPLQASAVVQAVGELNAAYQRGYAEALRAVRMGQIQAAREGVVPAPCPNGCEPGRFAPGCPVHDPTAPVLV